MAIVKGNTGPRGTSVFYRFENGYGASIITDGYGSEEGLLELAVIKWAGDKFKLTYETPITDDVLGYLNGVEVDELLARIEALSPADIAQERISRMEHDIKTKEAEIRKIEQQISDLRFEITSQEGSGE